MVLGDLSLWKLLNDLIRDPDPDLVNPASIDVRVGREVRLEVGPGTGNPSTSPPVQSSSSRATSRWCRRSSG